MQVLIYSEKVFNFIINGYYLIQDLMSYLLC